MRQVYIYALCEPDQPWNIRYVGKATQRREESMEQTLRRRHRMHLTSSQLVKSNYKNNWIKSLLQKNEIPVITLLSEGDETIGCLLETFYIKFYRDLVGLNLTNGNDGGEHYGGHRKPHTEETKKKISEAVSKTLIGNTRTLGYKQTEETKKKHSEVNKRLGLIPPSNKGNHHSPETKSRIVETNKKTWDDPELIRKHSELMKNIYRRKKESAILRD